MEIDQEELLQTYGSFKEIANHFDLIRDINNMITYCQLSCSEDASDCDSVEKLVYWCSNMKKYDAILDLLMIIQNSTLQVKKMKEIFYRENKISIRQLIINKYIDIIKIKENLVDAIKSKHGQDLDKGKIASYLDKFHKLLNDIDIMPLFNEYLYEKNECNKLNKIYNA